MPFTIPNLSDADSAYHSLRVRLDEQDYTLEFLYSTRAETYSLNVLDAEDKLLVAGLKIFIGVPLLFNYKHKPEMPLGELLAVTLGTDDTPPKLGELGPGKRVELTYYERAELAELRAELAADG